MFVQRDFSLLGICQCQVEWGMKFVGTVKIRGVDNFWRCGHPIRYASTLKLLIEDDYTGLKYVALRDTAPGIRNQLADKIQEFEVLGLLRVC